jgi:drug/metabolite transporter (DMT)-like permease
VSISLGDLVALVAALGWAGTSLMARALSGRVPALWYNALRFAAAAILLVLLLPWTLSQVDLSSVRLSALGFLLVSTVLGIGLGDTAFFESIRRLGVARAMPIASSYPLVTGVLAVWLLGETLTLGLVVGMVIVALGVWLLTSEGAEAIGGGLSSREVTVGIGLAAIAALGWAISAIAVRPAMETMDVLLASTLRMPIAAVALILIGRARGGRSGHLKLTPGIVLWLVAAGVATVASMSLFLWAVALVGPSRTAALTSSSPLFVAPLAFLVLKERFTLRLGLGIAVTVVGLILVVVS